MRMLLKLAILGIVIASCKHAKSEYDKNADITALVDARIARSSKRMDSRISELSGELDDNDKLINSMLSDLESLKNKK